MRMPFTLVFIGLLSLPAMAGEADVQSAQTVINRQIDALQNGRADEAYSYASPKIRQIYPTVDAFMSMVTNGYPMVKNPKNLAFGKSEEMGPGKVSQQVLILGPDGKDYEAMYTVEQQPDGSWLITSVSLRAANAPAA